MTEEKGGFMWAIYQMMNGKKCYVEEFDFEHYYEIDSEGVLYGDNGIEQYFNTDFLRFTWVIKEDEVKE